MRIALVETFRATFGASAAAAASYATLLLTDFRGFNQFGWIGAIGMLLCWTATYVLVPPLAMLFGTRLFGRPGPASTHETRGLARLVLGHPRPVLGVALALFVVATFGIFKRNGTWLETNFSRLRRADSFEHGERYWGPRMDAPLGAGPTRVPLLHASLRLGASSRARAAPAT